MSGNNRGCRFGPKATLVLTLIGFVLDLAIAIFAFILSGMGRGRLIDIYWFLFGLLYLASSVAYFLAVFALRGRKASLFLPLLVFKPLALINSTLFCFRNVISMILYDKSSLPHVLGHLSIDLHVLTTIEFVVVFILTVLHICFYIIIFRVNVVIKELVTANVNSTDDDNYDVGTDRTCCCGAFRIGIETATPMVALMGCVFQLYEALESFRNFSSCYSNLCSLKALFATYCLFSAFAYLLVVFALKERRSLLFLPCLCVVPVGLGFHVSNFGYTLYTIIAEQSNPEPGVIPLVDYIMQLLFMIVFAAFHAWFCSIIFRTYREIKQKYDSPEVQVLPVTYDYDKIYRRR